MRILNKEHWPYKITLENNTDGVEDWLFNEYGKFKNRWNAVYKFNSSDYYFRTEGDAIRFALIWL